MHLTGLFESCNLCSSLVLKKTGQLHLYPIVSNITDDSREVGPQSVFYLTKLSVTYLDQVLKSECPVILAPAEGELDQAQDRALEEWARDRGILIRTASPPRLAGHFADALYHYPSSKLHIIGVTGTNGKTSTAWMVYHIWKKMGIRGGMVGTLGVYYPDQDGNDIQIKTGYTTPRSQQLQQLFHEMLAAGVTHVVMEVSSEALALERTAGTRFQTALFTNITPDHLDQHGDMESYFRAKMILMRNVSASGGRLVIYTGTDGGRKVVRYLESEGLNPGELHTFQKPLEISLPVPAHFQKINGTLALLGTAGGGGGPVPSKAGDLFMDLPPIPGRFNVFHMDGSSGSMDRTWPEKAAVVDYAHTPDALETLLREVRELGARRILTIFGCGGNRDPLKRPSMGEIAGRLSDLVLLTNDNPRKEDPVAILNQIESGRTDGSCTMLRIPDRRQAIIRGVEFLKGEQCGPVVLVIAGKGHEEVQIFADRTERFSDTEELLQALGVER